MASLLKYSASQNLYGLAGKENTEECKEHSAHAVEKRSRNVAKDNMGARIIGGIQLPIKFGLVLIVSPKLINTEPRKQDADIRDNMQKPSGYYHAHEELL